MRLKKTRNNTIILIVVGLVVLAALVTAGIFAKKYYDLKANSSQATDEKAKSIADKVGKLIKLPTGEVPVVGEIKDKEKLKDQPFFADAQNGDQLLIFQKTSKAYIYREKENILINVDNVNISDTSKATEQKTDENKQ